MFGKTKEANEMDTLPAADLDGEFFGDEAAAEEAAHVAELRERVESVESQVNSQFTSLAAYAQIAQEQIELARSESKATSERTESRLTSLIERERADRIMAITGEAPTGSPDISARLDALEHSVAQIRAGLDECLDRQKQLADAITMLFDRKSASTPAAATEPAPLPAPAVTNESAGTPATGPISGLSLTG